MQDGPPTPEQLALFLPVTGSVDFDATTSVRYRQVGSGAWRDGHPMYRIRRNFSNSPDVGQIQDGFAWVIIDLVPGTTYDVEVTVNEGGSVETQTRQFSTRSLPPAAGPANKTISQGASANEIQNAFDSLNPGDVLEFENGTYNVNNLELDRSGTTSQPIYIRGESRDGVVLRDTAGRILRLLDANHVVVENMTLQGGSSDAGGAGLGAMNIGVWGGGNDNGTTRNTLRNLTIDGVDMGIAFYDEVTEALVYNNRVRGNNPWQRSVLDSNLSWDDDGINMPGSGNVAFNNTISGFGDTFSFAQHSGGSTLTETFSVHYYRNDIRNSLDDLVEVDHAKRNISFYDNRSHNSANCGSLDPLYGGPYLYARNICINPARTHTHKWNSTNSGQFLYNNTFIGTRTVVGHDPDTSGWYQPNNGPQRAYGFRNNILIYNGNGNLLWLESGGHDPIDWTHNSWYPDRQIQWDGVYSGLTQAQNQLGNTTPVFSGSNRRMSFDNLTVANPWTSQITLGADSLVEVQSSFVPQLGAGTAPKNSGVPIANINDGFAGAAPDRGAIIDGRPMPSWGDDGSAPPPAPPRPNPPSNLTTD